MFRHYLQTVLDVFPLDRVIDVDAFLEYDEAKKVWRVTHDVCIHLGTVANLRMHSVCGDRWRAESNTKTLSLYEGYECDGASRVMDTPDVRLAFLVHDPICTKIDGEYPVPSYFSRHALYRDIAIAQGCPKARARTHWLGLVAFNWAYSLAHQPKKETAA